MSNWRPVLVGLALIAVVGIVIAGTARIRSTAPVYARPAPSAPPGPAPSQVDGRVEDQAIQHRGARERVIRDQLAKQQRQQNEIALTTALQRYDGRAFVDLAVAVIDRNTGRTFSYEGQRAFEAGSIVKVDLLATLLLQAQRAGRPLSGQETGLAKAMIEASDNDAATQLWGRTGGISGSTKAFGLTATTSGAGGYWGLTTTTAEDQARLVAALADPSGPVRDDGGYVLGLMSQVDDDQAWGISAAALPGEAVAVKDGWLALDNQQGRWLVNSIGRITDADTDVVVVVLSRGHATLDAGIALVEAAAKESRAYLGG